MDIFSIIFFFIYMSIFFFTFFCHLSQCVFFVLFGEQKDIFFPIYELYFIIFGSFVLATSDSEDKIINLREKIL